MSESPQERFTEEICWLIADDEKQVSYHVENIPDITRISFVKTTLEKTLPIQVCIFNEKDPARVGWTITLKKDGSTCSPFSLPNGYASFEDFLEFVFNSLGEKITNSNR